MKKFTVVTQDGSVDESVVNLLPHSQSLGLVQK